MANTWNVLSIRCTTFQVHQPRAILGFLSKGLLIIGAL